ncbi:general odorant-binding protein 83a-like [Euwallacea fornicatus]|uniref:general odorant-binding protein 83a-like n=1 Tax=Euwallacea fornicatus TaxID=995702 RepID=UPI00338EB042
MSKFSIFLMLALSAMGSYTRNMALPPELQDYVSDLHNLCLDRTGLEESDHANYDMKSKDEKMMCYMKCLMLESKWMKPDGTIDYDFIDSEAHPDVREILMAAVNECRIIDAGADLCEKSYNFNKCLLKADPENWFLV